ISADFAEVIFPSRSNRGVKEDCINGHLQEPYTSLIITPNCVGLCVLGVSMVSPVGLSKGGSVQFAVSGGLFPNHVDEFQEAHVARVRELGYTGIFTRFDRDDPFATTEAPCRRVRSILADYDLTMVQAIGYRPPLIHPDEAIRRRGVATLRQAI